MTHYEKSLPKLGVGDDVKYYDDGKDGHPIKWVNGIVTEAGDESFVVQWEDFTDPTEYEFSKVEIIGNQIFENGERDKMNAPTPEEAAKEYAESKSTERFICTVSNIKTNASNDFQAGVSWRDAHPKPERGGEWRYCFDSVPTITKWYTVRNFITGRDAASVYCDSKDSIENHCKQNGFDYPGYEWLDESPSIPEQALPLIELIDIRNKLYNDLPTGNIDAFELLEQIKWHLNDLDTFCSRLDAVNKKVSIPKQGKGEEVAVHETILYAMGFSSAFTSDPQEGYHASKRFNKGDFVIHMPDEAEQLFVDENGNEVKYLSGLLKLLSTHPETKEIK